MARVTIRLVVDASTGKKNVLISYESDEDALPVEHEEAHRRIVDQLIEGGTLKASELGQIIVDREEETALPEGLSDEQASEVRESAEEKGVTQAAALRFADADALLVALRAELIPPSVQQEPVHYTVADDRSVVVVPPEKASWLPTLRRSGVEMIESPAGLETATCWPAIIPPAREGEESVSTESVLFLTGAQRGLLSVAGELLRLGCDRQQFALLENAGRQLGLLKTGAPPFFTVAQAMEARGAIRAFTPVPGSSEKVWIEAGFSHPMEGSARAAPESLLLIGADGEWSLIPDGPWRDGYQLFEILPPKTHLGLSPTEPAEKLRIPLRLATAERGEVASLWVLQEESVARVTALARSLPEPVLEHLTFAVLESNGPPWIVLRTPPGQSVPGLLPGGYSPLQQVGNLYLPSNTGLEPPLRRDKLIELVASSISNVYWITNSEPPLVYSVPDTSFRPLSDWVQYVVDRSQEVLRPWLASSLFDFDSFVSIGTEWSAGPPRQKKETRGDGPTLPPAPMPRHPQGTEPAPVPAEELESPVLEVRTPQAESGDQVDLAALEQAFLELELPVDAPARRPMWLAMARANTTLNRETNAGLCYVNAIWEPPLAESRDELRSWAEAEECWPPSAHLQQLLSADSPELSGARRASAAILAAAAGLEPEFGLDPARTQIWLDRCAETLDVRTLWLTQVAVARHAGGDPLALARTRDHILARLAGGLSLEKDVPSFLRFLGQGGGGEHVAADACAQALLSLWGLFEKTRRKRSVIEAPEEITNAYVGLIVATGLARLGRSDQARQLREQCLTVFGDQPGPVNGFLTSAFASRIDQALEGRPSGTPLPEDLEGQLNELETFARYKVDRLRQVSLILEPQERLDPIRSFQRLHAGLADPRGEEFAQLRGLADRQQVATTLEQLLTDADKNLAERARLYDGIMDFLPMVPAAAPTFLERILAGLDEVPANRRAILLEEALAVAGYLSHPRLAAQAVEKLQATVGELGSDGATAIATEFSACLRSLRRVGMREQAVSLLESLAAATGTGGLDSLTARVHLAAGMAFAGDMHRAEPVLEEATQALRQERLSVPNRLKLTRALANAWSQAPREAALEGIGALIFQLPEITDSYNTNTVQVDGQGNRGFCLSVIEFVEAIALGYASEDLALGDLGRRWMDEDEYLVRRRIHRDVGEDQ